MTLQPCKTNRQDIYRKGDRVYFFDCYHYQSVDKMKLATVTRDQCGPDVCILVDGEENYGDQWGLESGRLARVSDLFDICDDKVGTVKKATTAEEVERVRVKLYFNSNNVCLGGCADNYWLGCYNGEYVASEFFKLTPGFNPEGLKASELIEIQALTNPYAIKAAAAAAAEREAKLKADSTDRFIAWNKSIMTRRGFLPTDLSVALGSDRLCNIWLNLRERTIAEVSNEVKTLWISAVAVENRIELSAAGEQVETYIARYDNPASWSDVAADGSWSMTCETCEQTISVTEVATEIAPETLTEAEIESVKNIKKLLAADPLNVEIFWYVVQNYPVESVGFCNTAKIDTRTMQARTRAIQSAIKGSRQNEAISTHLTRILNIKPVKSGGHLKTR